MSVVELRQQGVFDIFPLRTAFRRRHDQLLLHVGKIRQLQQKRSKNRIRHAELGVQPLQCRPPSLSATDVVRHALTWLSRQRSI